MIRAPLKSSVSTSAIAAYEIFRSVTSKHARQNLPVLLDDVMDSGDPVIITKLGIPRAALIPARNLIFHEMIDVLGMKDRNRIDKPVDESIVELGENIERHLGLPPVVRTMWDRLQKPVTR